MPSTPASAQAPGLGCLLVVDAANVVGARPDGWWRDRVGATRRLADALTAAVAAGRLDTAALGQPGPGRPVRVVLVVEGAGRQGVAAGVAHDGSGRVLVVHAPSSGDDEVVQQVSSASGGTTADGVQVVVATADRQLRARVSAAGATVLGPGRLWAVLDVGRAGSPGRLAAGGRS